MPTRTDPSRRAAAHAAIADAIQARREQILALSHALHDDPEIRFEEHRAAARLCELLRGEGFEVQAPVAGLDTAFRARRRGTGPGPVVAFLCEYDALPVLGHACGHNLIATMSLYAGVALASELADFAGEVQVIGCPAEEGGGGKVILLDQGVFDGVDAALMLHGMAEDRAGMPTLARFGWEVEYLGVPAHAAMAPHDGVNALDAVRLAFAGIDAMRQQVPPDVRLHGIVTHGGDAANVVPERASMQLHARAADGAYLAGRLRSRVRGVIDGAALMTGCEVQVRDTGPAYDAMRVHDGLARRYAELAREVGRNVADAHGTSPVGSTDMANVSQRVPALHGLIRIDDVAAPHTAAFREAARSDRGDAAALDGALLLARLGYDLLTDEEFLRQVREEHASD